MLKFYIKLNLNSLKSNKTKGGLTMNNSFFTDEPVVGCTIDPAFNMMEYFGKKPTNRLKEAERDLFPEELLEDNGFVNCDDEHLSNYNTMEAWDAGSYPNMYPKTRKKQKMMTGFHLVKNYDLANVADPESYDGLYNPFAGETTDDLIVFVRRGHDEDGLAVLELENRGVFINYEDKPEPEEKEVKKMENDKLEQFILTHALNNLMPNGNKVVNKIVKIISTAESLEHPVLREAAYLMVKKCSNIFIYIQKSKFKGRRPAPDFFEDYKPREFPSYFQNESIAGITEKQLEKIFNIYYLLCRLTRMWCEKDWYMEVRKKYLN